MLQAAISVAPGAGPSPLRDHVCSARESGVLVDFAVVAVDPGAAEEAAGAQAGSGNPAGGRGGSMPVADAGAAELEGLVPGGVTALLTRYEATGEAGEVTEAPADLGAGLVRLVFLGIGDRSAVALRRAGAALGRRVAGGGTAVASVPRDLSPQGMEAFAEGVLLGSYRYRFTPTAGSGAPVWSDSADRRGGAGRSGAGGRGGTGRSGADVPSSAEEPDAADRSRAADRPGMAEFAGGVADSNGATRGAVRLLACEPAREADVSAAVGRAAAIAGAVGFARDLINTPSVRKNPEWLAEQAAGLAEPCGLRVRVRGGDELAAEGFGGIVAVGSGSASPPRLIELTYEPAGWDTHVVLVGKGITFDTGGLALKPNDNMKIMKTDMAGGAAVMAVLSALRSLGVGAKVTGLVAAAENMPSGSAMRPGDVIAHFGGRTVEVLNTDAEGRLVLADALAYADLNLDPNVMVDLATLTGAAQITLGTAAGALFTEDDDLAAALAAAGEASGDRIWRLPIVDEYRDALDSGVADLANISVRRQYGRPGAIVAALFLREFSGGRSWAHLDMAGPARATSDDAEISKGGTGFGVRLLLHWLADV